MGGPVMTISVRRPASRDCAVLFGPAGRVFPKSRTPTIAEGMPLRTKASRPAPARVAAKRSASGDGLSLCTSTVNPEPWILVTTGHCDRNEIGALIAIRNFSGHRAANESPHWRKNRRPARL
jgi:hypothetical protein